MPTPSDLSGADMKGKVVLATGAASGLGRATALRLGRLGAEVCLVDVNPKGLEETAGQMRALGARAHVHATDLTLAENCWASVAATVTAFGRIDALLNIAGITIFARSPEMSVADWDRTLAVNLSAPFFLCQAAIPHLVENRGAIVNVASVAATVPGAYTAAYCASKAGIVHLTKSLAMEYIHAPIRINAVAPGGMATPIGAAIRPPEGADPELLKRFRPLRGLVEVEDVAETVVFLASDAARGYHGACVTLDSGLSLS
jgi:NAD(P)-dependent dehydrogenase (short-subunit alcohol dehydrogenase family)